MTRAASGSTSPTTSMAPPGARPGRELRHLPPEGPPVGDRRPPVARVGGLDGPGKRQAVSIVAEFVQCPGRAGRTWCMGQHQPGRGNVWQEFLANRAERGFAREIVTPDAAQLSVRIMQHGLGPLRGAIGPPDQVVDLCLRYESAGVDQVIFVLQAGPNRHPPARLREPRAGRRAGDSSHRRGARAERELKAERLAPAIEAALARRPPARPPPATSSTRRPSSSAPPAPVAPAACASAWPSSGGGAALAGARPRGALAAGARRKRRSARAPLRQQARTARDLHRAGAPLRAQVRVRLRGRHSPTSSSATRTAARRRAGRWAYGTAPRPR
jgi:hypothetical protein